MDNADIEALEQDLSEIRQQRVEILDRQGQGEVRVHYADLQQLDDICRRMSGPAGMELSD